MSARAVKKKPAARASKARKPAKATAGNTGRKKTSEKVAKEKTSRTGSMQAGAGRSAKSPSKKATTAKPAASSVREKKVVKEKTRTAKSRRKAKKAPSPSRAARRRQLEKFRSLLLEKQESLIQAYNNTKVETRSPGLDGTEDYIDYAVSSYDRDFMLSLTELERAQLKTVEAALSRIEAGDYGLCSNCEKEIPTRRLEVEPWARHCIRCQELEEQGLLEDPTSDFDAGGQESGKADSDEDSEDDEEIDGGEEDVDGADDEDPDPAAEEEEELS